MFPQQIKSNITKRLEEPHKKPKLDRKSKITDFFNKSKEFKSNAKSSVGNSKLLLHVQNNSKQYYFAASFCENYRQGLFRKALSNVENALNADSAQSQRRLCKSDSTVSENAFKYPPTPFFDLTTTVQELKTLSYKSHKTFNDLPKINSNSRPATQLNDNKIFSNSALINTKENAINCSSKLQLEVTRKKSLTPSSSSTINNSENICGSEIFFRSNSESFMHSSRDNSQNTLSVLSLVNESTIQNSKTNILSKIRFNNNQSSSHINCYNENTQSNFIDLTLTSESDSQNTELGNLNRTKSFQNIINSQKHYYCNTNLSQEDLFGSSDDTPGIQNSQSQTILTCSSMQAETENLSDSFNLSISQENKTKEGKTLKKSRSRLSYVESPKIDFEDDANLVEEWKKKLIEGMQEIEKEEAVVFEKKFPVTVWHSQPNKQELIEKISAVLDQSEECGFIKFRRTCSSNCIFVDNR